jgi:hypothetical protein
VQCPWEGYFSLEWAAAVLSTCAAQHACVQAFNGVPTDVDTLRLIPPLQLCAGRAPSARRLQQEGDADGAVESGSSKWQLDSSHQHDSFHRRLERMHNGWTEWPAHSQAENQAVRSPTAPQARPGSVAPAPAAAQHSTAPVPA